jgi:hypothetical protein
VAADRNMLIGDISNNIHMIIHEGYRDKLQPEPRPNHNHNKKFAIKFYHPIFHTYACASKVFVDGGSNP